MKKLFIEIVGSSATSDMAAMYAERRPRVLAPVPTVPAVVVPDIGENDSNIVAA
jgi:hypothetical protein